MNKGGLQKYHLVVLMAFLHSSKDCRICTSLKEGFQKKSSLNLMASVALLHRGRGEIGSLRAFQRMLE